MKFSIIIPTYNRAKLISKTIISVINQAYADFEIIVVDDGSTDNTKEVVSIIKDPRLKYYYKTNGERGAARNFGVKTASGQYITFLDSDDILLPNYLTEANQFIEKTNTNVFFQLFEVRNTEKKLITKAESNVNDINNQLIFKGNIFACQGAFINKETFNQYKFLENRQLAGSEDYELWLRINASEKIECNPVVTSYLIEHEERSVLNFDPNQLIKRKELMLDYLFKDLKANQYYTPYKNVLYSNAYAYIALHLILANYKKTGIKFYLKAIIKRPLLFLSQKSLGIFKQLILSQSH